MQQPDLRFKICIFGDGGVGKTTLINRYVTGLFDDSFELTIGVDFRSKIIQIDDYLVYLQIWDLAGEDRFRFLMQDYVAGASGGIFMYDITRMSSLLNITNWYSVIKDGYGESTLFPIILVGGKLDLENYRAVEAEQAKSYVKDYDLVKLIECSSKTGENVEDIFFDLAQSLVRKIIF